MAAGCERLLAILNDHILTPDGTTQKTDHRLQQARTQMHKAKAHFLKQRLLQQLLQELSASYNGLNMRLGLAEAVHCLGLPMHVAGREGSLFGLGESHFDQLGGNTPQWQREKEQVVRSLEEELKKSKERLGEGVTPAAIKRRSDAISVMRGDETLLIMQLESKRGKLFTLLRESSEQLLSMLSEHKSVAEENQLVADHLLSKAKAMQLKLRTIKLQMLVTTYSHQTNAALAEIRAQLEGARSHLQQHVVECRKQLEDYSTLGPEFISLAQEYHQLKADAENKRWAIAELAKSQQRPQQ